MMPSVVLKVTSFGDKPLSSHDISALRTYALTCIGLGSPMLFEAEAGTDELAKRRGDQPRHETFVGYVDEAYMSSASHRLLTLLITATQVGSEQEHHVQMTISEHGASIAYVESETD